MDTDIYIYIYKIRSPRGSSRTPNNLPTALEGAQTGRPPTHRGHFQSCNDSLESETNKGP